MRDYLFKNFSLDTILNYFGEFVKKIGSADWRINIFSSDSKNPNKTMSLASTPVLSQGKTVNPRMNSKPRGKISSLRLKNIANWESKSFKQRIAKNSSSEKIILQNYFVFTDGEYTYFIPQFELARALFFRDSYLARSAPVFRVLEDDFQIDCSNDGGSVRINVLKNSNYPLNSFNDLSKRNHLCWILLDSQVRASYESIAKYQLQESSYTEDGKKWIFHFDPPDLDDVTIKIRATYDESRKYCFVHQILGFEGLQANIPENIEMFHPEFSIPGSKANEGKSPVAPDAPESFCVDDIDVANADTIRTEIDAEKVECEFKTPFVVKRVSEKEKSNATLSVTDGEEGKKVISQDVSMNESVAGQGKSAAEWNTINDTTDNDHLFERKFTCFSNMVDRLKANRWCEFISLDTKSLPRRGRSKKHLLSTDGSPRCVAIVQFKIRDKHIAFLEVDTSDAVKPISTLVIFVRDAGKLKYQIGKVMAEFVSDSLTWPTKLLSDYYGKRGYVRIPHPESKSGNKGVLLPNSVHGWANRCYLAVSKLR